MRLHHTNQPNKTGFTLIELLLVIAIIGLLLTGSMYAINQGRQKSRDTKRIADLSTIAKALELYLQENGYYPPTGCGYDCNGYRQSYDSSWDVLAAELEPYLGSSLPIDPINTACHPWTNDDCYSYAYGNVGRDTYGNTYDLTTHLETPGHPESCGKKNYYYAFSDIPWCGPYSDQIYEASPE